MEQELSLEAGNGERIRGHFYDTGDGAVGIYVHGLFADGDGTKSMHLWERAKSSGRSWLRFDQRGQGRSDGAQERFRLSRAAEDLQCVLRFIGNRPALLVGSSMGAWVSAHAALDPDSGIDALVLLAPAFNFIDSIYDSMEEDERRQWRQRSRHVFSTPYEPYEFSLDYEVVQDAREYDLYARRVSYSCPVVILHGEDDEIVPVDVSHRFVEHALSPTSLEILPGADHRLSDHEGRIVEVVDELWRQMEQR